MRHLIKFSIPIEVGNERLSHPDFGAKVQDLLKEIKAEAAYFTATDSQRGGYIILDVSDASQIPAIAEPLFLWLNADVDFFPVMTPEDLGKAGPAIAAAVKKWAK